MAGRPLQSLYLRRAIVTALRSDAGLIAIGTPPISSGDPIRVYGRRQPATLVWPFVRVSVTTEGPLRKGTSVRITVHSFSKAQFDDEVEQLNAAIQSALENAILDLSPSTKAYVSWISSQVVADAAEADAWHGIDSFDATIG